VYEIVSSPELTVGVVAYNHDRRVPADPKERMKYLAALTAFAGLEEHRHLSVTGALAGLSGEVGQVRWTILSPTHGQVSGAIAAGTPNYSSAIVLIQIGQLTVLVSGDADDGRIWHQLKERRPDLRVNVFRLPHHGAEWKNTRQAMDLAEVLDWLGAQFHVISVGSENQYSLPTESTLRALGMRAHRARV
jgi:beta-lactamase superfamily II metal-dependent hydrolase